MTSNRACAHPSCNCYVRAGEAVERDGQIYCSERCADHHGCNHAGCNCRWDVDQSADALTLGRRPSAAGAGPA